MLVTKFVELDLMLLDIQDSSTMTSVLEEYTQGIKSGQVLLLSKIRRLAGEDTRNIVRRAVQAGRRGRMAQCQPVSPAPPSPAEQGEQGEQGEETMVVQAVEPPITTCLSNRQIMHELALNPDYEISALEKNPEQRQAEETFKAAFYETLSTSLYEKDQSWLPTLVHDIKSRLLSLLQPSTPSHIALSTNLDDTIIQQQCQRGLFDTQTFLSYILDMMRQLCAPVRDVEIAGIASLKGRDDVDTFIVRMKSVNKVLGIMALDSANFHLRMAKPTLLPQITPYERNKFAQDLSSKTTTLEKTTQWLQSAIQISLSNQRQGQRTPTTAGLFHSAFLDLLCSDTVEPPETFTLDIQRIARLRQEIRSTVRLAALLLVARTFTAAGANSRPLTWSVLASRLAVLAPTASAENILLEVDRFVASANLNRTLLLSMIRRIKSDVKDPMVSLLERRLKAVLMGVLAGPGGEVRGLSAVGLGEVEEKVKEIAGGVEVLGRVNWGVHREWYEDIISRCLAQQGENLG